MHTVHHCRDTSHWLKLFSRTVFDLTVMFILAAHGSANAYAADIFRLTTSTHSETQNLILVVQERFGPATSVADWEEVKAVVADDPAKLQQFYELVGLRDGDAAICTRNGQFFWEGGNRQFYLQRFDSAPYPAFLVHDQIGSLYLGSWYGLNMNVLAVRPPDDTPGVPSCFDLNDNTVPEGWYLEYVRSGPASFTNGALWGKPIDTGIGLCKSMDDIQNVQSLEFEWDGSLNYSFWGMNHGVDLITKDGTRFRMLHCTATYNLPDQNALVIYTPEHTSVPPYAWPGDSNYAYVTAYPVEYGRFHHQLVIRDGVISFRATRLSDGSLVAETEQLTTEFQLDDIATVEFIVYATTDNVNWMDNLCFSYSQNDTTIWPSTTIPDVVDEGPDSPVELGVKFQSEVGGTITGIRFYKASANTGAHVGNLWTSNGVLLATAPFLNETASGWQQVLFATPVAIASNTVYVASYHANHGHYSCDVNYFTGKGMDRPPLHALADGVSGGNGVYAYGAESVFPHQTWNAANYWVDVVFRAASLPTPMSITVTPIIPTISIETSQQFTATCTSSDGTMLDITRQVIWTSSNTGVATIDADGLATAVSAGTTTISATLSDAVGSTTLTVHPPQIAIPTTSLPFGVVNTPYSATLTATGGILPYMWSIEGVLPSGLTLNPNGTISGTPTASGIFDFTVQVRDAGNPFQTVNKLLSISVVMSIWSSTTVPERVDDGPDSAVELGVKFRSDVNGIITGIRFYKGTANTGTHIGNLWTSDGMLLATVPFLNETASGWQQVLFATPVAIASNTVYVASYHANDGHYSADINYFEERGVDNSPLHALINGVSDGNGVYAYGASSLFPNETWNAANYYVDVLFQAVSPPVIRAAEMFRLTSSTHSETQNLTLVVQERFGPATSVADWEDIKSAVASNPAKLQRFYELVGLRDGDAAICARSGQFFWEGGNRQYYLQRFDSAPYPAFLVHDQIGTLYLGSWYGLDMHVLAKAEEEAPFLEYVTTHETHSETQQLADVVASYFGGNGKIADWRDIKAAVADDPSKLQSFYRTVGLQDWDAAICLRDGEYFYEGNRQYYLERFDAGPYPNFLVHDQVGSLYLGSWYGLNMNVLAVRLPDDTPGVPSCFDLNDNTVPEGWYLEYVRSGPASFTNGALWGKPIDTGIGLCKSMDDIQNVQSLEFEWDGSLNYSFWGMNHGVDLITKDGMRFRMLHCTATYNLPDQNALVIYTPEHTSVPPYARPGDPNYAYVTAYPSEYGSFHHQLIIQDGLIIFRATRLSDGSLVAEMEQPTSEFQLDDIATVEFNVYATTDNVNWMDNLCFSYSQNDTTIWPSTTVPEVVDGGPDSPVELGIKFQSDVAGTITGLRFYKANANTGAHVGNLWTSNGMLLATAPFLNETASGWQQVLFATPVAIASNTVYVASYHANHGHYSCDVNYFTGKGMDRPPLHALADGVSGANGVYAYGSSSVFPDQTWNAANYYVDIMFQAASPSPLPNLMSLQ